MLNKNYLFRIIAYILISVSASYLIALIYSLHLQGYVFFPPMATGVNQADVKELVPLNNALLLIILGVLCSLLIYSLAVIYLGQKKYGSLTYPVCVPRGVVSIFIFFSILMIVVMNMVTPMQVETYENKYRLVSKYKQQRMDLFMASDCSKDESSPANKGNGVCVYEYSYQGHVDAIKDLSKREIVTLNEKAVTDLSNVDPKELLLIRFLCCLYFIGILAGAKRNDEREKE